MIKKEIFIGFLIGLLATCAGVFLYSTLFLNHQLYHRLWQNQSAIDNNNISTIFHKFQYFIIVLQEPNWAGSVSSGHMLIGIHYIVSSR